MTCFVFLCFYTCYYVMHTRFVGSKFVLGAGWGVAKRWALIYASWSKHS